MIEQEELSRSSIKRKPIEWNLSAAKKRKRKQTGFIHYCYEAHNDQEHDTIPLYENFCYALALFRSRLSDQMLEAKSLLEKLLAFEVTGNFPIYLHEYPHCKDRSLSLHLLPVLHWIQEGFQAILGDSLKERLNQTIEHIVIHGKKIHEERPLPAGILSKWQSFVDPHSDFFFDPCSAKEWAELLVSWQVAVSKGRLASEEWKRWQTIWHPELLTFLGPNSYEKLEPEVTLLDIGMGHFLERYSHRVESDHPIHLQASLIQPFAVAPPALKEQTSQVGVHFVQPGTLLWGNLQCVHSLVYDSPRATCQAELLEKEVAFVFTLPKTVPLEGEEQTELAFYCNRHPAHLIWVNGKKATTFQLGDEITILSEALSIRLIFSLEEGEGVFFGHLLYGNRPHQKSCKGNLSFEAFDWKIALRTVTRVASCKIKVRLQSL